jgi:hypothetical protein
MFSSARSGSAPIRPLQCQGKCGRFRINSGTRKLLIPRSNDWALVGACDEFWALMGPILRCVLDRVLGGVLGLVFATKTATGYNHIEGCSGIVQPSAPRGPKPIRFARLVGSPLVQPSPCELTGLMFHRYASKLP